MSKRNNLIRGRMAIIMIAIMLCGIFAASPAIAVYGVYGSGDSGGGGAVTPTTTTTTTVITTEVKTEDDQKLDESLKETGTAIVNISDKADPIAEISSGVAEKLIEESIPIVVENTSVKLELSGQSLNLDSVKTALQDENAKVEIGAKVIDEVTKAEILNKAPLGQTTGLFSVGGVVVDLTAQITTSSGETSKIEGFNEPVAVTINLSALNLTDEEISQLTGSRLETDANGNIVTVNLGGTYNPVTKTFTFYTDKFSYYTVLKAKNLLKMNLTIDSTATTVNGIYKAIDVPATIINNRTMVPLRYIGEALGAKIDWAAKTKTITITQGTKKLTLVIDKAAPGLDVPATIRNNRTLVPLRYISESLGANVMWFPTTKTVQIVR